MKLREYAPNDEVLIGSGLLALRTALDMFKQAGAVKTARRIRSAISSAKGAQRHVGTLKFYNDNPDLREREKKRFPSP